MSRNQTTRIAVYIAIALVGMLVMSGLGLGAGLWLVSQTSGLDVFANAFSLMGGLDVDLPAPGVIEGHMLFSKQQIPLNDVDFGVSGLAVGDFDGDGRPEIGLTYFNRAILFGEDLSKKHTIAFDQDCYEVQFIDLERDGTAEFVLAGESTLCLADFSGATRWTHPMEDAFLSNVVPGDLTGDGTPELAVGSWRADSVAIFDASGNSLGNIKTGDSAAFQLADADGDGKAEVISAAYGGHVTATRLDGTRVKRFPCSMLNEVAMVPWPDAEGAPHVIAVDEEQIRILSFDNEEAALLDAPHLAASWGMDVFAAHARLTVPSASCLVLAASYEVGTEGTLLYVYNPEHELTYVEAFDKPIRGVAAFPADASGLENLVIAFDSQVWLYRLIPEAALVE